MINILLGILIVLQIILMLFLLFTNIKRYKTDKIFWAEQEEISARFLKQMKDRENLLSKELKGDTDEQDK